MSVPAETGFIKFKRWCPFKFENKTSAAKWQSISYRLIPLLTHLSFRRTIPLSPESIPPPPRQKRETFSPLLRCVSIYFSRNLSFLFLPRFYISR
jgi:hypothetical protein